MLAKDIMSQEVITVNEDTTIEELAKTLLKHNISGVPVIDNQGDLVGVVTEGDLLRKKANPRIPGFIGVLGGIIFYKGVERYQEDFEKLAAIKASEIMSADLVIANKDTELTDVASLMLTNNIKRLPVVEENRLVGIISRADIIKSLIE
ncbi:MAG: CBS domain-containing protein [Desulfotomaculum sp.]|nr:CBS domain-containing protein [Desulfotomaculum sp.]MCL0080904.1 CBS domain-containing protein [Peptococcaceae bacterium]